MNRRLSECEFVVIDTETTGFSPKKGSRLTEVGWVLASGIEDAGVIREQLINPGHDIPAKIQRITGITNDMVAQEPEIESCFPGMHLEWQDRVFVFHNSPFDFPFIQWAAACSGITLCEDIPILDTLFISRKLFPGISHSLPNLTERFGLSHTTQHRAGADAMATWQLLQIQARELEKRFGYVTVQELYGFQRSQRPKKISPDVLAVLRSAVEVSRQLRVFYRKPDAQPQWVSLLPIEIREDHGYTYLMVAGRTPGTTFKYRVDRIERVE